MAPRVAGVVGWVWKHRHRLAAVGAAGMLAGLAAALWRPLGEAVQIGGDEHFEVTKALLWARGHALYDEVWNDQPPLHTALLALAFKVFGPGIGVARAVAAGFGLALVAGAWAAVRQRCGAVAAYVAAFALVASPEVFRLAVSVMLEGPAFAVALWALWAAGRWEQNRCWRWLVLSGAVYGAALQIKLTAAVAGPALLAGLALAGRGEGWARWTREVARDVAVWSGAAVGVFVGLGAVLGGTYDLLWASHAEAGGLSAEARSMAFTPRLLLQQPEVLWCGGVGLAFVVGRGQWRRMAVPLVWLGTALGVAVVHRPWWHYYYLHLAIPLAWLAGHGLAEGLRWTWGAAAGRLLGWQFVAGLAGVSLLMGELVSTGGLRLVEEVELVRELPRVRDNALVEQMRRYAQGTRWVYTRFTMYPFHAGLEVVPELAVLPLKRFWSGRITGEQIVAMLRARRPELVLLSTERGSAELEEWLAVEYVRVYEDAAHRLYVVRELARE